MSLSAPFIARPVATILIMASFLAAGLFAYRQLPVAAVPRVEFPTISVSAQLPGASPETMANSVATVLEKQFSGIAGITSMSSTSTQGQTSITLQFDLSRDIDGAALDVQSAIGAATRQLPPDMPAPPSFRKVNPADSPVIWVAIRSEVLPLSDVHEFAETKIAQQLSTLPGVAQVSIYGAQKYAVRVRVDLDKLAARGLTVDDVRSAIAAANSNDPVGQLSGPSKTVILDATGPITRAEGYRSVVIGYQNGAPVRISDVGAALDSVENDRIASWLNGTRAIIVGIQRQPDANTIEVVDRIKAMLPKLTASMPPAMELEVLADRSISIRDSVHTVQEHLGLAILLVVFVIYLFLRSARATVIPALALPVSLVGTFAGMHLFGFSIDNISLLALTLAVGFVVDDAIVMLENIVRHMEMGKKPLRAAYDGAAEVGFTIISMTISLVAVFIPVLFMGGVVGRMFFEFGMVITMAILISGVVSLTLTPMLAPRLITERHLHARPNLLVRLFDVFFQGLTTFYRVTLRLALKARWLILLATVATMVLTAKLYLDIPKGFFPNEDTGLVVAATQGADDVSFPAMAERQKEVADIVRADPAVSTVMSSVGSGPGANTTNAGTIFFTLKPREERPPSSEVVARLRRATAGVPGINVFFRDVQNINITGGGQRASYQYTLQSASYEDLLEAAPKMEARMRAIPGVVDVNSDLAIKARQAKVIIDRERASQLGLKVEDVRSQLYSAFGSRQVSTIFTPTNTYSVILEADPEFTTGPDQLRRLTIRTPSGASVPLDAIARIEQKAAPLIVRHNGQLPAATISFNLAPGTSLGQAVDAIGAAERDAQLPDTVSSEFTGSAQVFQEALAGQGLLLFAAVLVIYIVLGILYESFIHPITILSGLPSAGIGALLTLMFYKTDLSVIAMIGVVMLIGIVKKNSIMIVDFAVQRRAEGLSPREAVEEACLLRFRPIMMTTAAAILGILPIALGQGAGAELRQPLGIAVVGGLIVSQILTLYVTPVVFLFLDRFERGRAPAAVRIEPVPAPADAAAATAEDERARELAEIMRLDRRREREREAPPPEQVAAE